MQHKITLNSLNEKNCQWYYNYNTRKLVVHDNSNYFSYEYLSDGSYSFMLPTRYIRTGDPYEKAFEVEGFKKITEEQAQLLKAYMKC